MIAAILGVSMSAGGRCEERLAILHTKEYAAFEFSPDVADDVVKVVGAFEKDHRRGQIGPIADEAFERAKHIEAKTPRPANTTAFASSGDRDRPGLVRAGHVRDYAKRLT